MSAQRPEVTVEHVWSGLEGVYNKGLAKAIGVSNWSAAQIERVMKVAKVPIHNVQVCCKLSFRNHLFNEIPFQFPLNNRSLVTFVINIKIVILFN